MGLFKKSQEKIEKEDRIKEFQKKCNFLTDRGECILGTNSVFEYGCQGEKCIFFMRILKAKEGEYLGKNNR